MPKTSAWTRDSWIAQSIKLSVDDLHKVCTRWKRRADRIGLVIGDVPDPDHTTSQELAEWSWNVRTRYVLRATQIEKAYEGSVLEAIHCIEHGCLAFDRAKRILEAKGCHSALLNDIEGLTELLIEQLNHVDPDDVARTRELVEGYPHIGPLIEADG